jgi:hypothetical protein
MRSRRLFSSARERIGSDETVRHVKCIVILMICGA